MISINHIDIQEVPGLNPELLVLWLEYVVSAEGLVCGDVNLVFCTDEHLLGVNQTYLNHDYYTDIVTFDYCEDGVVMGDLFISVDRVSDNAKLYKASFLNELRRVCVHGLLHLCGYGDKTESEIEQMRSKEDFYLDNYVSRET
jgi:probable rRNA maturation factor